MVRLLHAYFFQFDQFFVNILLLIYSIIVGLVNIPLFLINFLLFGWKYLSRITPDVILLQCYEDEAFAGVMMASDFTNFAMIPDRLHQGIVLCIYFITNITSWNEIHLPTIVCPPSSVFREKKERKMERKKERKKNRTRQLLCSRLLFPYNVTKPLYYAVTNPFATISLNLSTMLSWTPLLRYH